MEIMREGLSYTLDTMNQLEKKFGADTELFFIIGADSMADLPKWHKAKELVSKVHFIATTRPGVEVDLEEVKKFFGESAKNIYRIEVPGIDISSTELRERVKVGKSIKYLVPETVEEYILKENLYK